jgi:hypothetical protein
MDSVISIIMDMKSIERQTNMKIESRLWTTDGIEHGARFVESVKR